MTKKEKIYKLIEFWVRHGQAFTDAQITAEVGLTIADLDELWTEAEIILDKARNKPEVTPTGDKLLEEVRSWIDFRVQENQ